MNPQHKQFTFFLGFLVLLAIVIYVGLKRKKQVPTTYQMNVDTHTSTTTAGATGGVGTTQQQTQTPLFPIKRGMNGKYVLALQKGLNRSFKAGLVEDGDYGKNTYDAVVKYIDTSFYSATWKPSVNGVLWSQFVALGFDKYA